MTHCFCLPQTSGAASEEQETPVSGTVATVTAGTSASEASGQLSGIPSIRVVTADGQEHGHMEAVPGSSTVTPNDGTIELETK